MTKEIRIVNRNMYSFIQERKRFGRWKIVWDGYGEYSSVKTFTDPAEEVILNWYIEDYLGRNSKNTTVVFSHVYQNK